MTELKAYGMTVTMMNRVNRRMRTVGMMSLMSVQVTPLSSSKLSLLTPLRTEPWSCWASRSDGLFLLFDISVRGIEQSMVRQQAEHSPPESAAH